MEPPILDEIAHHEAGHAVLGALLGSVPDTVTIAAKGNVVAFSGSSGCYRLVHCPRTLDQMTISFAGYAAHVKYMPSAEERARRAAHVDFVRAQQCMIVLYLNADDQEALMKRKREEAARLVDHYWPAIQRVAHALMQNGTINSSQLRVLIADVDDGKGSDAVKG